MEILKKLRLKTILFATFFIRLLFLPWNIHSDINITYWWGKFAADFGFRGFYDWLDFGGHWHPDQPMLNIYYDWLVRLLYQLIYKVLWFLNTNIPIFPSKFMQWYFDFGNQILLKVPMLIADILIIYFGYKFVKNYFNETKAKIFAIVMAFYPPLILGSAIWGSGDSIVNLFALLAIYLVFNKRYLLSFLLFTISLLYKSSLLIWIPVFFIVLIKNKVKPKNLFLPFIALITVVYLICLPFTPIEFNPLYWFFQTMSLKILPGIMDQVTANALNLWALIYGLQPRLDNFNLFSLINVRTFSILVCIILYSYDLFYLYKNFTLKRLLLSLVNITLISFTFMTRMHERYTFPALIPLFLLYFYDKRYLKYFIFLSVSHFYNVFCTWFFPNILNFYPLILVFSLGNIYITLKLLYTGKAWK